MLYFDIILKCFNYIYSNYPLYTLGSVFFLTILFYFTWINIKKSIGKIKYIIILIRLILIILLFPLLINQNYNFETHSKENQKIGILIDNSISIKNSLLNQKIFFLDSFINHLKDLNIKEDFKLAFYNLDSLTIYNKIKFDNISTNFDYFNKILKKEKLDQFILISDGNINSGNPTLSYNKKINVIGIGNEKYKYNNIKISNIINNRIGDSTSFNIDFNINLKNNPQKGILTILTNNETQQIYIDTIIFLEGSYNLNKKLTFESELFKNNYLFSIKLINDIENNLIDNVWKKDIDHQNDINILFISGKINYNTTFIKEILNRISGIKFDHYIVSDKNNNIIFKDYEYIILDNFPNNKTQIPYFKQMIYKNKKLIFFEGIGNSLSIVDSVINIMFKDRFLFTDSINKNKKLNLYHNITIGPINKKYKIFNVDKGNSNIFFSDSSIAITSNDSFNAVLIPNISELDFYQKNKYDNNKINIYFEDFFKKILLNQNNINLTLKKQNYFKGEKLLFNLDYPKYVNNKDIMIYINNIKNNSIDSIFYNKNKNIYLEHEGKYMIYSKLIGTNIKNINLNSKIVSVAKNNIEGEIVFQNIDFLKNISKLSNGEYVNSEDYSRKYLERINFSSINTIKRNIFNALDIFIKELIYVYAIILFSLEIYLRKRIGLM